MSKSDKRQQPQKIKYFLPSTGKKIVHFILYFGNMVKNSLKRKTFAHEENLSSSSLTFFRAFLYVGIPTCSQISTQPQSHKKM